MKITFLLGEPYWRSAGRREVAVSLPAPASVAQALAALAGAVPALRADLAGTEGAPAVFVDDEVAGPEHALTGDARLHLVWPVSGG
jgi:hypothetical protein